MRFVDGVIGVARLAAREGAGSVGRPRLAVERIVVVDAEGVAAEQGDVVGLARMHLPVEVRRIAVGLGQARDVGGRDAADDLVVFLVLLDDHHHVVEARHALEAAFGRGRRRGAEHRHRQA